MTDPVLVGVLTSVTAVFAAAYWQLCVRPEALLSLVSEEAGWLHRGVIVLLLAVFGILVFVFAFLTGLALVVIAN